MTSRGWFDNIICGTGTAFSHKWKHQKPWGPGQVHGTTLDSLQTITGDPYKGVAFYDDVVKSLEYKIEVTNGAGHIHINNDPNSPVKSHSERAVQCSAAGQSPGQTGRAPVLRWLDRAGIQGRRPQR
jgi:hypothetical protein